MHPTRAGRLDGVPVRVESEYKRIGALNLFAAFDTRTGEVIGICRRRKRMIELIELLEEIEGDRNRASAKREQAPLPACGERRVRGRQRAEPAPSMSA